MISATSAGTSDSTNSARRSRDAAGTGSISNSRTRSGPDSAADGHKLPVGLASQAERLVVRPDIGAGIGGEVRVDDAVATEGGIEVPGGGQGGSSPTHDRERAG